MSERRTWNDIVERAINDAVLYRLVTLDRRGDATREELLIATVLWLAADRQRLMDLEIHRLMNEPANAKRTNPNAER